jgi:hypothetical protein
MRRAARRAPAAALSTQVSEAPCRHCRRPLIYGWDEGLLVRADALALDELVAAALRDAGRRVYVVTEGRQIIRETADRAGSLRLARSRHAEHLCRAEVTKVAPVVQKQLELFDHESVLPPARGEGGAWHR